MKNMFTIAGCCIAACICADTWHWTACVPEAINSTKPLGVYGINAALAGNWTNLVTQLTGVPQEGDSIVISTDYAATTAYGIGFGPIADTGLAEIRYDKGQIPFRQSNMRLVNGGSVIFATAASSSTWTGGLVLDGTGTVDIAKASTQLTIQKSCEGVGCTLVKEGSGTFKVCEDGGLWNTRRYAVNRTLLRGGTLAINIGKCWPLPNGAEMRFDSDDAGIRLAIGSDAAKYGDDKGHGLVIESGSLVESDAVSNTSHGITSPSGCKVWFVGTPTVSNMVFTGALYDSAGLVWMPDDPSFTFTFRRAVHPTTGEIAISNGMVRVCDGASFPALARIVVGGSGARLQVEHSQAIGRNTDVLFEASGGVYGKIELADGVSLDCYDLYVDGVRQPVGVYGSGESGAPNRNDALFEGRGLLNVLGDDNGIIVGFR